MLRFELTDGSTVDVAVTRLFNAGYAGRDQASVRAHIDELAELGVPGPSQVPALYPVSPYLAQQAESVAVQNEKSSGEAEWAIVFTDDGVLLTAACDQTDRDLETYGVAWSKNASPDVVARKAWRLDDVEDHVDDIRIEAWVTDSRGSESRIQDGTLGDLLPPAHWIRELKDQGYARPGTVLISGTIPMAPEVDQFAPGWRVRLTDPTNEETIELSYTVEKMPEPIG